MSNPSPNDARQWDMSDDYGSVYLTVDANWAVARCADDTVQRWTTHACKVGEYHTQQQEDGYSTVKEIVSGYFAEKQGEIEAYIAEMVRRAQSA